MEVNEQTFPDPVFRGWILDSANLGGAGSDGVLSKEELAGITDITFRGQAGAQIADLTGIGYFAALDTLSVPYHALESLDLRANPRLKYVNCSYNRLTDLRLDGLSALDALYCEFNYMQSLDLSGNPELTTIYCRHNLLEQLDLSHNTKLIFIETFDNRLTEIDVSMLKDLEFLHIDHNRLQRLDMSANLNLKGGGFVVRNSDMRELILPDIPGFTVYYDDFAEQDPVLGYERLEWFADPDYTIPVTGDVGALGGDRTGAVSRTPASALSRLDGGRVCGGRPGKAVSALRRRKGARHCRGQGRNGIGTDRVGRRAGNVRRPRLERAHGGDRG